MTKNVYRVKYQKLNSAKMAPQQKILWMDELLQNEENHVFISVRKKMPLVPLILALRNRQIS